jgi:hypothetical protein
LHKKCQVAQPDTPITRMAPRGRCRSQPGGNTAIDIERVSIHERGSLSRQEDGRADQLVELAPAAGRSAFLQPGGKFRIADRCLVQRGLEITGRDRIDLQSVLGPVRAHAARQVLDRAFGRGIGRDAGPGELALDRSDVDDLATIAATPSLAAAAMVTSKGEMETT